MRLRNVLYSVLAILFVLNWIFASDPYSARTDGPAYFRYIGILIVGLGTFTLAEIVDKYLRHIR